MKDQDMAREDIAEILAEAKACVGDYTLDRSDMIIICEMALRAWNQERRAEKATRANQQKHAEMTNAALLAGSSVPEIRERAELVRRKLEVDEQLAELKKKIGRAKAAAFERGEYLPAKEYRRLEGRQLALKNESQALQARLGELRREEARTAGVENDRFVHTFLRQAKRDLPPETFAMLESRAREFDAR